MIQYAPEVRSSMPTADHSLAAHTHHNLAAAHTPLADTRFALGHTRRLAGRIHLVGHTPIAAAAAAADSIVGNTAAAAVVHTDDGSFAAGTRTSLFWGLSHRPHSSRPQEWSAAPCR